MGPDAKVFAIPGGRLAPKPCGDGGAFLARSLQAGCDHEGLFYLDVSGD